MAVAIKQQGCGSADDGRRHAGAAQFKDGSFTLSNDLCAWVAGLPEQDMISEQAPNLVSRCNDVRLRKMVPLRRAA